MNSLSEYFHYCASENTLCIYADANMRNGGMNPPGMGMHGIPLDPFIVAEEGAILPLRGGFVILPRDESRKDNVNRMVPQEFRPKNPAQSIVAYFDFISSSNQLELHDRKGREGGRMPPGEGLEGIPLDAYALAGSGKLVFFKDGFIIRPADEKLRQGVNEKVPLHLRSTGKYPELAA